MRRNSKSFEIALSAIACAVAALALTMGCYVEMLLGVGYVIAVFALMVPLSKNFVWGNVLAAIGALLFAFLFSMAVFWCLIPFAAFFAFHPLVNWLQKRYVKRNLFHVLCFAGKTVWFILAMWLSWTVVFVPILGMDQTTWYPYIAKYFYLVLILGGTVFFAVYDYLIFLCQRSVNIVVARFKR